MMPVRIEIDDVGRGGQYVGTPPYKMRFIHHDVHGDTGVVVELPSNLCRSQHKLRQLGLEAIEYITGERS